MALFSSAAIDTRNWPLARIGRNLGLSTRLSNQVNLCMAQQSALHAALAQSLPASPHFRYYYVTTESARESALFAAPPGHTPERTKAVSHLLVVCANIGVNSGEYPWCAVFAIEAIVYSTDRLTTVFVSKVDTTGLTTRTKDNTGNTIPARPIASAFIAWLVRRSHCPAKRLVLSLFARAQGQYLFPGSVEHGGKHVLDDRGLVKWWCGTLDPVLREYSSEKQDEEQVEEGKGSDPHIHSQAYLVVPGHDKHETSAFFPASVKTDGEGQKRWISGHPLREISSYPNAPPRCLVPRFPDDPKARFLLELDEELPSAPIDATTTQSPSKRGNGQWKSVKTLEQFWDMMAFRQECSSGRLVGFIWILFTPSDLSSVGEDVTNDAASLSEPDQSSPSEWKTSSVLAKKRRRLRGVIHAREPRVKKTRTEPVLSDTTLSAAIPVLNTPNSDVPLVLKPKAYQRVFELLLRLDFANLEIGCRSTHKWTQELAVVAGSKYDDLGIDLVGLRPARDQSSTTAKVPGSQSSTIAAINVLNVKRVRKVPKDEGQPGASQFNNDRGTINTLGASLIRKKVKE